MSETSGSTPWRREDDPNRAVFEREEALLAKGPSGSVSYEEQERARLREDPAQQAARLLRVAHQNVTRTRDRAEERTQPPAKERTFELTRDRTREITPDEMLQAQAEMARIAMENARQEEAARAREAEAAATTRSRVRAPEPPATERGRNRGRQ